MVSVIMAGGVGQRFWPRSRRRKPKQFLDLTGEGTMLALTLDRVARRSRPEQVLILTHASQVAAVRDAVGGRIPDDNIVGEPEGRNTAPSVALAAIMVRKRFGDVPFMVLPADHIVGDLERYDEAVDRAETHAGGHDALVTFGIRPSRPETGYGYVKAAGEVGEGTHRVESFHEKPGRSQAERFVADGCYFWNSGMFMWRPSVLLAAVEQYLPDLADVMGRLDGVLGTKRFPGVFNDVYPQAPVISVDYGIMEKADNVAVVRGDFYWNDVGSWESLRELHDPDGQGNVVVGDHVVVDSVNSTLFAPERFVALVGLQDVVVVDSGDATLVCHRDRVQDVRMVVEALTRRGKDDLY